MLSASLGSRKSADHELLLETRLNLEPVGSPLAWPVNTVFALSDDSLHPFFLGEFEERRAFGVDEHRDGAVTVQLDFENPILRIKRRSRAFRHHGRNKIREGWFGHADSSHETQGGAK